jgi:hypothetical protein
VYLHILHQKLPFWYLYFLPFLWNSIVLLNGNWNKSSSEIYKDFLIWWQACIVHLPRSFWDNIQLGTALLSLAIKKYYSRQIFSIRYMVFDLNFDCNKDSAWRSPCLLAAVMSWLLLNGNWNKSSSEIYKDFLIWWQACIVHLPRSFWDNILTSPNHKVMSPTSAFFAVFVNKGIHRSKLFCFSSNFNYVDFLYGLVMDHKMFFVNLRYNWVQHYLAWQ